ncbi:MAG: DUF5717 family protein [Lachnospiraceae bacterium]|nr:DUF5717 family protein [Lachnospiraceae bacterium]
MRATVERILSGKFDYEKGSLDISVSKIELSLCPGEEYTGSFFVSAGNGRLTEGSVICHDNRLELINDSFSGASQEIGYTFSAKGLEEGDVVQGEISIISNQGEYYLPYTVTVLNHTVDTSLGNIRNLFHFTNLAKSNWDEAVKLFYSDSFVNILAGSDRQYLKTYLGLSKYYGNEQNVEEFLLTINKKHAIEYICDRTDIVLHDVESTVSEQVTITRNGWGYTRLFVKADADFIELSTDDISDGDFDGSYLLYGFTIDPEKLHAGNNYGKITFSNAYVSFSVNVTASKNELNKQDFSKYVELWHLRLDLMTYFEAFRSRKITMDSWIAESDRIVDRMLTLNERMSLAKLYKAQILIAGERFNEAKWILDQVENDYIENNRTHSANYAYLLYLNTLIDRDESFVNEMTAIVADLYDEDPTSADLAWILLHLSEELALSPTRKWFFIERQVAELHCTSTLLYVEALSLLSADPAMLVKMSRFELIIMRYAAANNLITVELARQFVYIASREVKYNRAIYEILKACYDVLPTDETVECICNSLIAGGVTGEEYIQWYLLAIERNLRITRLYEFYMDSLNLNKDYSIPKMVFLYFSYECNLSWERAAYLYDRVIESKDEMPEIYESYRLKMERFVTDEMLKGHINRDLAKVYRFILPDFSISEDMGEALSRLLFVRRIKVNDSRIRNIVLYHNKEIVETVYPITGGEAYVPIYERDYTLMFEDILSNRYIKSVDYDLEKLIVPGKLSEMIGQDVTGNIEYDVYCATSVHESGSESDDLRDRYLRIIASDVVDPEFKNEIRGKLMTYCYYNDHIRDLDDILDKAEPYELNRQIRSDVVKFMILRGFFDKAFDWATEYGVEGCDFSDILKLCEKLISRDEYMARESLTDLAATLFFSGKYDDITLRYLVINYRGMTKNLRRIFNAANIMIPELADMCGRMLVQMMYTSYYVPERMDVFKRYVKLGADPDIKRAFLYQCSFDYFVKEQLTEGYVFDELKALEEKEGSLDTVCKLAFLKYCSEKPAMDAETVNTVRKYLGELMDAGICMTFFKEFQDVEPRIAGYSDKTLIEYKTEPGRKVYIHYIVETGDDSTGEYVTEEMPDVYGGVHVKAFVLFFGENLLYYVTENTDTEEILTESGNIAKSDTGENTDTRFNEINDIAIAGTLGDYDTVEKLLYEYYRNDYIVRNMFKLQ